jgi:hypothetical protein
MKTADFRKKINRFVCNNNGSTIVFALMIMAILSVIGFYSINDSVSEGNIARNHGIYKENLYRSEFAVRTIIQNIEDEPDPKDSINPTSDDYDITVNIPIETDLDWSDLKAIDLINNSQYIAVYNGIASGSNLDLTEPTQMYSYTIYGRGFSDDNSEFIIEAGFRKRY